jgi:hypothetical protein
MTPGMGGPNGQMPGGSGPNSMGGSNGQAPPGANGPGIQGANGSSPFSGGKGDGAEAVAQQFYEKLMSDDVADMSDLFSHKASGKAKSFRDGKASDSMIDEMKAAFTNVKMASSKQIQGTHIVLLEENGANQSAAPAGRGSRGRSAKKIGKKVQFKIVTENGKLVIQDIQARDH